MFVKARGKIVYPEEKTNVGGIVNFLQCCQLCENFAAGLDFPCFSGIIKYIVRIK